MGTAAAQQTHDQNRPNPYHMQASNQSTHQLQPPNQLQQYPYTPPPSYSPYPAPQHQPGPLQGYSPQQYSENPQSHAAQPPYPTSYSSGTQMPQPNTQGYPSASHGSKNGYLGAPLQPRRSHSQPPRVRFTDQDEYDSESTNSTDDSSPRRKHRRHRHHRSRSRDPDYDKYYDQDSDRDSYDSSHSHHHHNKERSHKSRDTFLGAGAGSLVGDAIFPGLGTVGGLLLGGYGGRKHALKKERSRSEMSSSHHRDEDGRDEYRDDGRSHRHGGDHRRHRKEGGSGWDEDSATFKMGTAIR